MKIHFHKEYVRFFLLCCQICFTTVSVSDVCALCKMIEETFIGEILNELCNT